MEINTKVNLKITILMAKVFSTLLTEINTKVNLKITILMAKVFTTKLMAKVFFLGLMAANKKECTRMGS
jgi:hypothetical protein